MPLDFTINTKNIRLDNITGGMIFNYTGVYKFTVNLLFWSGANTRKGTLLGVAKIDTNKIIGHSVYILTGWASQTDDSDSVTFLVNVDSIDDVYELKIARWQSATETIDINENFVVEWNVTRLSSVAVVVNYLGEL